MPTSEPVVIRVEVEAGNSQDAINKMKGVFQGLAGDASNAGKKASDGLDQISHHSLTALDNVRLLRDDLGVRIPRSMEKAIASSQMMMAGINAVGTGLLAIGAIDIGIRIAQGIGKAYEKWIDVDGAVRKYQEDAMKAAEQKLFDEGALETQITMMTDLNGQIDALIAKRNNSAGLMGHLLLGQDYFSPSDAKNLGDLLNTQQQQELHRMEEEFKAREQQRETEMKTQEARVPEYARPAIERNFAHLRAGDEMEYQGRRDFYVADAYNQGIPAWNKDHPDQPRQAITLPANDGWTKAKAQEDSADADFNLKQKDRARQTAEELGRIHEQSLESELRGEALYTQKMSYEIEELKRKGIDSAAAENDIRARYHNEAMQRLQQQELATEELQMRGAMAGMTGAGKIQAEDVLETGRVMGDKDLDEETKQKRIEAIHQQTNADILAEQRTFTQQIDALSDASAEHQISGFARIQADAKKQLDDLQKRFDEATRDIDRSSPQGQSLMTFYTGQLQRGQGAINAGANQQTSDLMRRNEEETEQIEAQARSKLLASEKQKTAAIEEEYQERVQKYRDALDQEQISQDDFNRRVVAAQQDMQAQLQQQAQETRQKIASELSGLFSAHPLEALQRMGEKFAGEAGGAMLQRLSAHFGGNTIEQGPQTIFERIAGAPGGLRGGGSGSRTAHSAAYAEIHVDQASIVAGGVSSSMPSTNRYAQPAGIGGGSTWMSGSSAHGFGGSTAGSFGVGYLPSGVGGGMGPMNVGGAGSSSTGPAASGFNGSTPVGSAPPPGLGAAGVVRNTMQGVQTARGIAGMFRNGGFTLGRTGSQAGLQTSDTLGNVTLNPDGSTTSTMASGANASASAASSSWNQSMLGGGMSVSNTLGAAGAGLGLFSASKTGGFGGMMGGAMSGAQLGMEVGGPIGAAIGAAAGLAIGFFGGGEQARVWWLKNGHQRLNNDVSAFQDGQMDYLSAYMDMESLKTQAHQTLSKMGYEGSRYYHDTVTPEISRQEGTLTREARAGRQDYGPASAQFDQGGWTGDFGSMATGPDSGWAHMRSGEFVVQEQPAATHAGALEAIRAGASHADMAAYYGGGRRMPAQQSAGWGGDLHVHAIDGKQALNFLMSNKHQVRAAMNASYAENSGGSDAGF